MPDHHQNDQTTASTTLEWQGIDDGVSEDNSPGRSQDGQQPLGRYTLLKELGRGGMGVVFLAWDPSLKRKVALKMLHAGLYASKDRFERLLREARAVARLRHPSIIEIGDLDVERRFFTMRLVEGPSLAQQLRSQGHFGADEAAAICLRLARALQHAHAAGVLHRDIKPDNVLMEKGNPILTDFGLARDLDTSHTITQGVLGTPAYLSPEQVNGEPATTASDQYALGVLLYESLTGRRPFAASEPVELFRQILEETPPPLELQGIPGGLARICRRSMARHPSARFADMRSMADALEQWSDGSGSLSRAGDLWLRWQTWMRQRRRRGLMLLGGLSLLALLVPGPLQALLKQQRVQLRWVDTRNHISDLLAEGQFEEAQARFEAFVTLHENVNTPAHSAALLFWGQQEAAAGRLSSARGLLSQAYTITQEPHIAAESLEALSDVLAAEQDYERLHTALKVLSENYPGHTSKKLNALKAELGMAMRRPLPSDDPITNALSQATKTDYRVWDAFLWDVDSDNKSELFLSAFGSDELLHVGIEPSLPLRTRHPSSFHPLSKNLPGATNNKVFPLPFGRLAMRSLRPGSVLMSWEEQGMVERARWPEHAFDVASADLDQDGQRELYVGNWSLLKVSRDGEHWITTDAHPPTSRSNSIIRALTVADLDGRGEALFVGTSGWGTYDVQVLRAASGGLTMTARQTLGFVRDLEVIEVHGKRLLAALQTTRPDRFIDMDAFGPTLPHGEPAGIHLLALDDGRLVPQAHIPMPRASDRWPKVEHYSWELLSGDLDGDGNTELIMRDQFKQGWSWVFSAQQDGDWSMYPMQSVRPLALLDLDGDGDDELLLRLQEDEHEGELWVVGAGSDVLPAVEPPYIPSQAPAPALDWDLTERWRRAEALAQIGLKEEASAALQTLARTGGGGVAWLRAAKLLEELEAHPQAVEHYLAAVSEAPDLAAEALEGAIRCMEKERDFPAVLQLIRQRQQLADPPTALQQRAEELTALAARPVLRFDFSEGIPDGWVVDSPHGVRWRADKQGVVLRSGLNQKLLSLPVTLTGEPISIELSVSIEDIEWGGLVGLSVVQAPGGQPLPRAAEAGELPGYQIAWHMYGGSGVYRTSLSCPDTTSVHGRHERSLEQFVGDQVVRVEHSPAEGRVSCVLGLAEEPEERIIYSSDQLPTGEVELIFSGPSSHTTAELLIRQISLTGMQLRAPTPTPTTTANRLLAAHNPSEALAVLRNVEGEAALLAATTARAELGLLEQARQSLRKVLSISDDPEQVLKRMLLISPEIFVPLLRTHLGPSYYPLFHNVYETRALSHPTAERTVEPLIQYLDGVLEVSLTSITTKEERLAFIELLRLRAGAYRHRARLPTAHQHLRRAETLLALAAATDLGSEQAVTLAEEQSRILWERGRLLTAHGAYNEAISTLLESIDHAPSPVITADAIKHDASLELLHSHPSWQDLEQLHQ